MIKLYDYADKPGQWAVSIARPGYPYIVISAFITFVFALLGLTILALTGIFITLFILYFFRDPDRVTPSDPKAIISPADGKVILAEDIDDNPYLEGPCKRISVFMNVFNVHVNRNPCDGKIVETFYQPGKFFSANLDKAAMSNEHNAIVIDSLKGKRLCVVQIAGLIARRIICNLQPGDDVKKGARFGMICFGSRLDIYLPDSCLLNVQVGEKVLAGTSILAFFQK